MRTEAWPKGAAVAVVILTALAAGPARAQVMDSEPHLFLILDQLELAPGREGRPVTFDATSWWGGDVQRAWLRAEGAQGTARAGRELQAEAFYGRLVAPYWDALVGVRVDHRWGSERATVAHLAVGIQGLAPLWFEVQPTLYLSQKGHLSAQLETEYELFFTQRAVLQPRLEVQAAAQNQPELRVGAGLSDLELGARLRYELRRELAPYVGIAWHRRFGATARLAHAGGEDASSFSIVAGVRLWH